MKSLKKKQPITTCTGIKLLFIRLQAQKNSNKNLILYTIIAMLLEMELFKRVLFRHLFNYTSTVRKNGIYIMI
jgi:hypothetical protein